MSVMCDGAGRPFAGSPSAIFDKKGWLPGKGKNVTFSLDAALVGSSRIVWSGYEPSPISTMPPGLTFE